MTDKNVAWFEDLTKADVEIAGGKGASLGEMINADLPVPPGFAVTAQAYERFVHEAGIIEEINELLGEVDVDDSEGLSETGEKVRNMILEAEMPAEVREDILEAYRELSDRSQEPDVSVAVRSSATAEDMPDASFAGQQDTYLNVSGEEELLENIQKCWASLFTDRAIFYREKNDYAHDQVLISVPVQKMVNAEKAGVMFTSHPSTGDKEKVVIEANWGLGETVVSGSVTPDTYVVNKETQEIMDVTIGSKEATITRDPETGETIEEQTPSEKREAQVINEEEAAELAELGAKLEEHYGRPQDAEWAKENGKMYLVQSRPITVLYGEEEEETEEAGELGEVLVKGLGASPGRGSGKVKVIPSADEIGRVKEGDILVAEMTAPDWVPAMRRAKAIVTDEGGTTCHAAIVSRELGTPAVVGTGNAMEILEEEMGVTVDGSSGVVYEGIEKEKEEQEKEKTGPTEAVTPVIPTATQVKANISLPDVAEKVARETEPDGVGLLRAEHMLLTIGKHPRKILEEGGEDEMLEQFADGIHTVAEAVSPHPVYYRTLDLKTAEFRNLEGGEDEPEEPNPMIGWRGVRRFVDPDNPKEQEILKIELRAIKQVAEEGLDNVGVMLPMAQHPDELKRFKRVAREVGLEPHEDFDIGIMIEIPAAALIIEEFIEEGIDFVSFGTNDLTQFTLAVDRDNERIARLYDERHPAVQKLIKRVIKKCNEAGVESSICGQAGSYPDVVKKLVNYGITSVSANPDAVQEVRKMVNRTERQIMLSKAREDVEDEE